jgi:hypothetical protein
MERAVCTSRFVAAPEGRINGQSEAFQCLAQFLHCYSQVQRGLKKHPKQDARRQAAFHAAASRDAGMEGGTCLIPIIKQK